MVQKFGLLPDGTQTSLYTITWGNLRADITDCGATLVRLFVPGKNGTTADIVLGYDSAEGYLNGSAFLGATVGRSANRIQGASFSLNGKKIMLPANEGGNNLHSGPDFYHTRLWQVEKLETNSIRLRLSSPNGDQGYPGNAVIRVTYTLEYPGQLRITYDAVCDRDTVFNLTNHSYFNLAGHEHYEEAMNQTLMMPARFFNPDDAENIPTGELRSVCGTPMDFRKPKPLGRDIGADYEPLHLQGGYDHNFEVFCMPCAILSHEASGRTMAVFTDCPGMQLYTANFTDDTGKNGAQYPKRSGVCLETQYYPNALNNPQWPQPITRAGEPYHSETIYRFA